ncbi:hypothetical protein [Rhizobium tubonense]|uniref:Uncharacterized protein n=1 Tax=Rhizobium tubonense TaxID=484088 RepID=A0A2W4CVU1_9HYPH|nr:hypothetical protein [Rhizobium tubonense]PZM14928.1 hypothetical protein CPY51_09030 [Rhizobium tubonense]
MNDDTKAQQAIEETAKKAVGGHELPIAGPHAKDHLIDESKTPGAGTLPDKNDGSVSAGAG